MRMIWPSLMLTLALTACGPQEEAKAPAPKPESKPTTSAPSPTGGEAGEPASTAPPAASAVANGEIDLCGLVADPAKIFGAPMVATKGKSGNGIAGGCSWASAEGAATITTVIASVMTDASLQASGQADMTAKKLYQQYLAEARAAAVVEDVADVGEYAYWQVGRGGSGKLLFAKGDRLVRMSISTTDTAADVKALATKLGKELAKGL